MYRTFFAALLFVVTTTATWAQTPQPFPRPGTQPPPAQQPPQPQPTTKPAQPAPQQPTPPPQTTPAAKPAPNAAPTEAMLGAPIYPNAQFLTSYDAGRGQRFYLFGVLSSFSEMVQFYRSALKQRGELLFESPATHTFEISRFRDEAMAFPPSVTIKDYSAGGSPGYPNPVVGGQTTHFPTIIQIVPVPSASPQ
jgi:hypothetical protein